ncbi:MAG: DUF4185 domain-containing protein [Pseudonocardiaceae bacterium]|nr:DUF4185 domain-containing protein [Pseudonocardiaceae bacterium]
MRTRTRIVVVMVACLSATLAPPGSAVGQPAADVAPLAGPPPSTFFSTVGIDAAATVGAPAVGDNANHGDLWPNCWSDDDHVYTSYGDGIGYGTTFSDIGVARISGMPGTLAGTQLAAGNQVGQIWTANHNRKPTGMACVGGTLYLAVQDLALDFNDAPGATIARSDDKGRTWTWNRTAPMFGGGVFTTIMFLDYGKAYGNAPDGYVYAYGLDHNWRDSFNDRVPDPVDVYLGRVPRASVLNRTAWQFFAGNDGAGVPQWTSNISQRMAVLHDDRRIYQNVGTAGRVRNLTQISQGGIVYNKPLNRYIYTSWSEYTFEFYESATPWGPWRHFTPKDFGGYPWFRYKHGGYTTTIPSKYISADGRSMWLQSNVCPCGGGCWWGYTWPRRYNLNQLVYTTGTMFADGGWFGSTPTVQVRRDGVWHGVTGLRITPGYPTSAAAGTNRTYVLSFDATTGDGIRIIGGAGGPATFTSIGELQAFYGNVIADPSFEAQPTTVVSSPWEVEGPGPDPKGIDRGLGFAQHGANNAFIRTTGTAFNAIKQTVPVRANTNYRLTGWVRDSGNFPDGFFGVRNAAGGVHAERRYGALPGYTLLTVDFNSGANTTMTVFAGFWAPGADAWVQVDNLNLAPR